MSVRRRVALRAVGLATGYLLASCDAPPQPSPRASASPTPLVANVASFAGGVWVKSRGTLEWVKAAVGTPLRAGDQLKTDPRSGASLRFLDGVVIEVQPETLLTVEGPASTRIDAGRLRLDGSSEKPRRPAELSAPRFRWTDSPEDPSPPKLAVESSSEGDRIDQYQGSGRVETKRGGRVQLAPNTRLTVDAAGRAGAVTRLLDAPELLLPANGARLSYPEPTTAVTVLQWKVVAGAVSYRVQVGTDGWFTAPLVDRTLTQRSFELGGLAQGRYYWQVTPVDASGKAGSPSELGRFSIGPRPPAPRLLVERLVVRKGILQVAGRTDPGAVVFVDGQAIDTAADGSFEEFITLRDPAVRSIRVAARDRTGGVTEQQHPLPRER
jgi:hypothetical protein